MKGRKGFTLIELMVVILIVGILAAVAIPILRGRIDAAKWSEGKAMMGTIATAIRAYHAEQGPGAANPGGFYIDDPCNLGFIDGDLDGTYFKETDGDLSVAWTAITMDPLAFTITGDKTGVLRPQVITLDEDGAFIVITP